MGLLADEHDAGQGKLSRIVDGERRSSTQLLKSVHALHSGHALEFDIARPRGGQKGEPPPGCLLTGD